MRQSELFTKVERNFPKDEIAINARFLERGGFIYKNSAGVYSYLPLGWRVIQKIAAIIRQEMDSIGGQEMFMPALVEKKYLDASGRWDVEVGFEAKGKKEKQANFSLGWTHEEVLTAIAAKYVSSYKDLPFAAYQIQTKFRNEARAKSGLLRGREFLMKDLYSFHASEEDFEKYYGRVAQAYRNIFRRVGLKAYYTLAAGGDFTANYTHEFQVVAENGEDTIFICTKCEYAENKEISKLKEGDKCPKCGAEVKKEKSIEVGNIFPLGTKYSKVLNLSFLDKEGEKKDVVMGSYGIGLGRLMATAVELYHDEKGIIWPATIAPFSAHLIELEGASGDAFYRDLQSAGVEVLYDDRNISAGEKFAEADQIGAPVRFVVSKKTGEQVEMKMRNESASKLIGKKEAISVVKGGLNI